jgi:methylmalonyl-CoA/ethylmalonyl-CoA epimerase
LSDAEGVAVQVRSFDHVAVVVRSLRDAVRLYVDTLGGVFVSGADEDPREMRNVQIKLGDRKLELLQPLTPNCYLNKFLDRFGEGFHHMTLFVDDIYEAARELTEKGYEVVDLDDSDPEWREVYIRPKSGFGTLIQLTDTPLDWQQPRGDCTLEDVLAGRQVWSGQKSVRRPAEMGPPLDQR